MSNPKTSPTSPTDLAGLPRAGMTSAHNSADNGAHVRAIDLAAARPGGLRWKGLRFCGLPHPSRGRLIGSDPSGAVEIWWSLYDVAALTPSTERVGGVEYHLPRPQDAGEEPAETCDVLPGTCYPDGSSTAFTRDVVPLLDADDLPGLLDLMRRWHETTVRAGRPDDGPIPG